MTDAPTHVESLRSALHRLMEARPDIVVIGEDIRDPYGGAFKVTQGLSTKFPDRVFATPISEAAIVGVAAGMAMRGFRPVAEIMFGDFLTLAADQIINTAAKFPLMYRGKVSVPMVLRTPMGGGRGYGPTHSQSIEKHFLGVPGLTVVSPSVAHEAGGLLEQAVLGGTQPTLFVEYKNLYATRRLESTNNLHVRTAPGSGVWQTMVVENFDKGRPDVVVLAYGGPTALVVRVMNDLAREEIRVRSVFPALISAPLDEAAFRDELPNGIPLLVAEESTAGFTWGSEIVASLFEGATRRTDRRVRRLTSGADVVPAAEKLESEMLLTEQKLSRAILELLQ